MGIGITFDDKYHTFDTWGLRLRKIYIPMPEVKEKLIDIPGADGSIDLTEIHGRPKYKERKGIQLEFDLMDGSYTNWMSRYTQIANAIHGRKVKMVLDNEKSRYYIARLSIDSKKSDPVFSNFVFSGTAEPFKVSSQSTAEPWKWDSFSFRNGTTKNLADIVVSGANKTVTVGGGSIPTMPEFIVSNANGLSVTYKGVRYSLPNGRTKIVEIQIGAQDEQLTFSGRGTVSVDYRGRYL